MKQSYFLDHQATVGADRRLSFLSQGYAMIGRVLFCYTHCVFFMRVAGGISCYPSCCRVRKPCTRFNHNWYYTVFALAVGCLLMPVYADQNEPTEGFVEITQGSREMVERGLAYLSENQSENGSFNADRYGQHVGVTALACMAFMADRTLARQGQVWGWS